MMNVQFLRFVDIGDKPERVLVEKGKKQETESESPKKNIFTYIIDSIELVSSPFLYHKEESQLLGIYYQTKIFLSES